MASRGAKPKPAALRLVDGSHRNTRHGKLDLAVPVAPASGKLAPTGLRGTALKAWKRWIEPASWLDVSREPAAIAFCRLWEEFDTKPEMFTAARHGQLRAYMSELGLTDERRRVLDKAQQSDEFFD